MTYKLLAIGDLSFHIPKNFKIVHSTMSLDKYNEWHGISFCAAILIPKKTDIKDINEILSNLQKKHNIHKFIIEAKNLNDEDLIALCNNYSDIKFSEVIDSSNLKYLLPKSQFLKKERYQDAFKNVLKLLNLSSSINDIEKNLNTILKSAMDIEVARVIFSPHSDHFREQIKNAGKLFIEIVDTVSQTNTTSLFFIAKYEIRKNSTEMSLLKKIADSTFLSIKRILRVEHLENLEQHWTATFNAFDAAIGIIDKNCDFIKVNYTFEKYFGKKSLSVMDIVGAYNWPPDTNEIKFQSNNRTYNAHFHIYSQGWIFIARDITEKEKMEKQILESSKMAELGMIGSSIAHEINNPLGGMLSYIQLIRMGLSPQHPFMSDIQEMEAATLKCKAIVENLLGFARKPDSKDLKIVSLDSIVEEALSLCNFNMKYKGVKIDFSPNHDRDSYILANSNNIVQAIKNIIQNSIEATEDFGGKISISIESSDDNLDLIIKDDGHGIETKYQSKIFNPLFTTKKASKHPGLGLTVAFQIIQDHNGNLEIFSQPKGGTTAKISFKRPDLDT